jgi:hypothetical protein
MRKEMDYENKYGNRSGYVRRLRVWR